MPLIPCPACGREISIAAEACPQCGHPNRATTQASQGPTCYACSATATTRCQRCNALSCAEHVKSIYVPHGKSGAYELRCESCYSTAMAWKIVGWVIMGVILLVVALIFFGHH